MGNKSSSIEPGSVTPSAAFGRLRIDSPHRGRSPHSRRHLETHDDGRFTQIMRSGSLSDVRVGERKPLLAPLPKTGAVGSAFEHRQLSTLPSGESLASVVAPPLAVWIAPALLCALAYALYNIFIKKGSASIHPILGGVILQFVAAILGSLLLLFIIIEQSTNEKDDNNLYYDGDGIKWAICAGISVGAAEILSFFVSSLGVQAMQSIPIIIGGSVMFGTVLGFVILKETLSFSGWFGVLMISVGISLVGLDPAATGAA